MTPQNLFIETHNGTYLEEGETQTGVPKLQVQSQAYLSPPYISSVSIWRLLGDIHLSV